MEPRFRSLRIIGAVLKVLAWVVLTVGVIAGLVMLAGAIASTSSGPYWAGLAILGPAGSLIGSLLGGLLAIGCGVLSFITLYAYGDAIFLALAIEENTRETAYYLKGGDNYRQQL
jgi:hypothetical protein